MDSRKKLFTQNNKKDYTHIKKDNMESITYLKFKSLLSFILLTSHNKYVLELSPDYLIEKYLTYFDKIENIKEDKHIESTLHFKLKEVLKEYEDKWSVYVDSLKRKDKINKIFIDED